jgi:hypothetical protein
MEPGRYACVRSVLPFVPSALTLLPDKGIFCALFSSVRPSARPVPETDGHVAEMDG